jgi:hypothetical protein
MAFRVIAPLILLAGVEVPHVYKGRIITSIPDPDQRVHLLEVGMVEEVPDPLPPGVAADAPAPAPAVEGTTAAPAAQRPAATASKDTWAAYVVAAGVASEQEAAKLTRDQLMGLFAS